MSQDARPLDAELLAQQSRWLHRLAYALTRDEDAASELAQDALLAGLRSPPRVAGDASALRRWLATVARHLAWRRKRERATRTAREGRAARPEAQPCERDTLERLELQRELAEALLALPEPARTAVVMRYFDELPAREIAARLGITEEAARQRVARGLALLRRGLDTSERRETRDWRASCLAWLSVASPGDEGASPGAHVGAGSSVLWGGLVMSTKMKFAAVAVLAALALGIGAWRAFNAIRAPRPPERVAALAASELDAALPGAGSSPAESVLEREPLAAKDAGAEREPRAFDRDNELFGIAFDPAGRALPGVSIAAFVRRDGGYTSWLDPQLLLEPVEQARAQSDERGEFVLRLPRARPFDLRLSHPDFALLHLGSRQAGERVEARMQPAARLVGRVVRREGGAALAGTKIRAWPSSSDSMSTHARLDVLRLTTDAEGRFDVGQLPAVALAFELDHPSMAPQWMYLSPIAGQTLERTFELDGGETVCGRVIDQSSGQPIAGAQIGLGWSSVRSTRTDAKGEYRLEGCVPSRPELAARAAGYGFQTRTWIPSPLDPSAAPTPGHVDFELTPAVSVRGVLVATDGQALAGAYVAAVGSEYSKFRDLAPQQHEWVAARSGADGSFELVGARSDIALSLLVRLEGYGTSCFALPEARAGQSLIDIGRIALSAGELVLGDLVDEAGRAIANWPLQLVGLNADRQAHVPLPVWSWGTVQLAFAAFERESRDRAANPDDFADYLRVHAPEWDTLPHFAGTRTARTDDLGRFSFADVAPGSYRVEAKEPGQPKGATAAVEVVSGRPTQRVRVVRALGLAIRGRLCDPDGQPVAQAWIQLLREVGDGAVQRSGAYVRSDGAGRFAFEGLERGTYTLAIDRPAPAVGDADARDLADLVRRGVVAGGPELELRMQRATYIVGRVLDARGMPLALARVLALDARGDAAARAASDAAGRFRLRVAPGSLYELVTDGTDADPVVFPQLATTAPSAPPLRMPGVVPGGAEVELRLP